MVRMRGQLEKILAKHTGQKVDKIHADTDRDNIMTAEEALKYGLIDKVMEKRA
jgi:ATP-dependent Clp protease protease subunit